MPKTVPQIPGIEPGRLPFSPVVEANGLVFLAGQVGAPPDGDVVEGGITAEVRQVLDNVGALIDAATVAGANSVESVDFTLRESNPARGRTLSEATKQAMTKAE